MDIFNRREARCELHVKRQGLKTPVDAFADKMTKIYKDEADRRDEGLHALSKILSLSCRGKIVASTIGPVT